MKRYQERKLAKPKTKCSRCSKRIKNKRFSFEFEGREGLCGYCYGELSYYAAETKMWY